MSTYSTNQFKAGLKILLDNEPYNILENEFVKPGKGQAFNRVRLRNLKNQKVLDKTFKSGETFEAADVSEAALQFLYQDGDFWYFMDPASYEQCAVPHAVVEPVAHWIQAEDICMVTTWNGIALTIDPPNFIVSQIVTTDPGLRGDTVTGGTKPATLATGAVVRVPLFIQQGEMIRVDTRTGDYVARVK